MLAQGSQSHLHLALAASSPGLAQLWWGKRKLRVAQLGEGGPQKTARTVGWGSPVSSRNARDLLPAHPLDGGSRRGVARLLILAKPCIFTNKSDMKPVPLGVVLGKGEGPLSQDRAAHPLGWPGSRWPSTRSEERNRSPLLLLWWPNSGTEAAEPNTKPCLQSRVWDTATPTKLWILILNRSLLHNGPVDSSMVAGSQSPSLAHKMGIQLEHTEGRGFAKHSLGVWHTNTGSGSVISFPFFRFSHWVSL